MRARSAASGAALRGSAGELLHTLSAAAGRAWTSCHRVGAVDQHLIRFTGWRRMGPGAGERGGGVVGAGPAQGLRACARRIWSGSTRRPRGPTRAARARRGRLRAAREYEERPAGGGPAGRLGAHKAEAKNHRSANEPASRPLTRGAGDEDGRWRTVPHNLQSLLTPKPDTWASRRATLGPTASSWRRAR